MATDKSSTSSTSQVLTTTAVTQLQSLPNVAHQLPIKLNSTNYLLWQAQLMPLLHSYDLAKHIDGSFPPPSLTLSDNQPNLIYHSWFRQDQLVLSWIVGSISEAFVPQVVGATSAHEAWQKLAKSYAAGSKAQDKG